MKIKKVIFHLLVSICIFHNLVAQEYKVEQGTVSDANLVPRTAKFRINPYSDNDKINHFFIKEVYFNRRVSPKNGIDFSKISYTITPKNTETIVFFGEYDAMTESKYELFITEENSYKIKIPEFSWSGTSLPKYSDDDTKNYIREDGKVVDGEYVLKIDLLRYSGDAKKEPESVGNIQEYTIEIDTTPPIIDFKTLFVCDDPLENKYFRYIVPVNHGKSEYEYMANKWEIIGNCSSDAFKYDLLSSLPVFCVERFSDNDCLKIIAEDDLENKSEKEFHIESREFVSTQTEEPQEEKTSIFDYLKTVQEALSPFCKVFELDLAKPYCTEFQIHQDNQEFISSNFGKYPSYLVFLANNQPEIRIPIEYSDKTLSFQLKKNNNLMKNTYHIFVSDGNDISFFLGRKFIYDSDARLQIKTLVGFDGRDYLSVPDILFPASSPSFLENDELVHENLQTIKTVVEIINDNIEDIAYVEILGYANPERAEYGNKILLQENEDSLLPLSQKRANYVKQIMEMMGIPKGLLVTVPCGGVPYETNPKDKEISYKNRRVRFNVVKK